MTRTIETKFYTFSQNNSGGYYVENEEHGVGEYVIIEAVNVDEAWEKLESIGDNVNGFWISCPCCGDRWNKPWDDEGDEVPLIYGKPAENYDCYIHYYDGTIKKCEGK